MCLFLVGLFFLPPSDNEEDRVSRNGRPLSGSANLSGVEFKDEEETVTTKSIQITQATETTTTTRKRGGVPSKTVDLGAAAHYTGDRSSLDADDAKVPLPSCTTLTTDLGHCCTSA